MGVPTACMGKIGSGGRKPPPYGLSLRFYRSDKLKLELGDIFYDFC